MHKKNKKSIIFEKMHIFICSCAKKNIPLHKILIIEHKTYQNMEEIKSFNQCIEDSIKKNWDLDALTDYKGAIS